MILSKEGGRQEVELVGPDSMGDTAWASSVPEPISPAGVPILGLAEEKEGSEHVAPGTSALDRDMERLRSLGQSAAGGSPSSVEEGGTL